MLVQIDGVAPDSFYKPCLGAKIVGHCALYK
jgi:hypothetical protein